MFPNIAQSQHVLLPYPRDGKTCQFTTISKYLLVVSDTYIF